MNARGGGGGGGRAALPGATELTADGSAAWGSGGGSGESAAWDGRRQASGAAADIIGLDAAFEEVIGSDPFAVVSGSGGGGLQSLRGRGEGEFETIDWTFYQEKDRQYVARRLTLIFGSICFVIAAPADTAAK
jgi:hypothetical protein